MPPYSNMRKTSLASLPPLPADLPPHQRRTTSGRAIRANTTRPTNYYARPFTTVTQEEMVEVVPAIGFFPAITFFADAIDALPKEVVRQFTLMKEVEAKVHGPAAQLGAMCDELMEAPVPRRRGGPLPAAALMTFTAANSNAGSTNASVINGVVPNVTRYGQDSAAGSTVGDDLQDTEESFARRHKYAELRALAVNLIPNMDEKNALLAEAIRVMNSQLSRIDGVMPHVESEIPEEARLGSMTHWAYSDNRKKTKAAAQLSRRDIGATNTLAAAASAMHDADIALTRREGGRESTKTGRGRNRDLDSEFEERPRKPAKLGTKARLAQPAGLGITNGEPVKRRKLEKIVNTVPGMERQTSNAGRAGNKAKAVTAAAVAAAAAAAAEDLVRKNKPAKAVPAQIKRRTAGSAHASPALASSPLGLHGAVNNADQQAAKQQSVRNRQNSTASNLRHERLAEESTSRPTSAAGKTNGADRSTSRLKRQREDTEGGGDAADKPENDRNVTRIGEDERGRPVPSRSNSSNKTPSGGASKVGTPKTESFSGDAPGMSRVRSTRASKGVETTPDAPPVKGHRRGGTSGVGSVSGLMKQIAPFNKSPDLDRHRKSDSDGSSISDPTDDAAANAAPGTERRRSEQDGASNSRPGSSMRRNASEPNTATAAGDFSGQIRQDHEEADVEPLDDQDDQMADGPDDVPGLVPDDGNDIEDYDDEDEPAVPLSPSLTPEVEAQRAESEQLDEEEEEEEGEEEEEEDDNDITLEDAGAEAEAEDEEDDADDPDPDDPNEPKYCYCQRGSYGDMVGCDNPKCPREWFHLGCTDLTEMPSEEESWFCNFCRPKNGAGNGRRGAARGKSRG